jgi:hypothetical protein
VTDEPQGKTDEELLRFFIQHSTHSWTQPTIGNMEAALARIVARVESLEASEDEAIRKGRAAEARVVSLTEALRDIEGYSQEYRARAIARAALADVGEGTPEK